MILIDFEDMGWVSTAELLKYIGMVLQWMHMKVLEIIIVVACFVMLLDYYIIIIYSWAWQWLQAANFTHN